MGAKESSGSGVVLLIGCALFCLFVVSGGSHNGVVTLVLCVVYLVVFIMLSNVVFLFKAVGCLQLISGKVST